MSFTSSKADAHLVKFVARYYPLPVTCNGVLMERRDFLHNAIHVVEWQGLRIGVYSNTGRRDDWHHDRSVNFHGVLALDPKLPWVPTIEGAWGVRIDIVDCPHIKLVLPARREVVRDAFLDDLRRACRRIIFETMLAQGSPPDLPYHQYAAARALGLDYPEPQPRLRSWYPKARHDWCNNHHTPDLPVSINPDTAVVIRPGTIATSDNFTLASGRGSPRRPGPPVERRLPVRGLSLVRQPRLCHPAADHRYQQRHAAGHHRHLPDGHRA